MSKSPATLSPLVGPADPVDWLFVFKFNAASFPGCTDDGVAPKPGTKGIFGGTVQPYPNGHSQQYVYASSKQPKLAKGVGCVGATLTDPLGATFAQVYNHPGCSYLLWNDQFYANPIASQSEPWGHSKGMLVWGESGDGLVLQVSTPSWPASGSKAHPRQHDGNTLGCIQDDDVEVSQHFFSLKLTHEDVVTVLKALVNASVVTSVAHPEIVNNGGPADVQALVKQLGKLSSSKQTLVAKLSSGVQIISKPSLIAAPPWQLVSAQLNAVPLRVASWWDYPLIYSTEANTKIGCWPAGLGRSGPVQIATEGAWNGVKIGLKGGLGTNFNHAKIGVSTDTARPLCIFGDMNQQGALGPGYACPGQKCSSSQNGRGGTFYVLQNKTLWSELTGLLKGTTAPATGPNECPK